MKRRSRLKRGFWWLISKWPRNKGMEHHLHKSIIKYRRNQRAEEGHGLSIEAMNLEKSWKSREDLVRIS